MAERKSHLLESFLPNYQHHILELSLNVSNEAFSAAHVLCTPLYFEPCFQSFYQSVPHHCHYHTDLKTPMLPFLAIILNLGPCLCNPHLGFLFDGSVTATFLSSDKTGF